MEKSDGPNMTPSWTKFVSDYRSDKRFQYFPHAHVGGIIFPRMIKVFEAFEGKPWRQADVMKALRIAKLTGGDGAGGRMVRKAAENLGLLWFQDSVLWLTPSGQAMADGASPGGIIERLLWRYQLSNPINEGAIGFNIHPHHALVEILAAVSDHVTRDEFILFVGRVRNRDEIPEALGLISEWRKLTTVAQDEVMGGLGPEFSRRATDASYVLGFHACASYLERFTDNRNRKGIKFGGKGRVRALNLLATNRKSPIIDFASKSDCLAFYGDTEQAADETANLDYLLDTSQYEKAVELFKTLPAQLRRGMTPKQFKDAVFLEKDLEDYLVSRLHLIEPGLLLEKRQRGTEIGTIDILAKSKEGDFVVIELKKVRASDKVFGQLCRYMGCIMKHDATQGQKTRGYIIGSDIDRKLVYAASVVPNDGVRLKKFRRDTANKEIFVVDHAPGSA